MDTQRHRNHRRVIAGPRPLQTDNPQLRGQPVDIGGHPRRRCGAPGRPPCTTVTPGRGRRRIVHLPSPDGRPFVDSPSTGHSRRDLPERSFSTGSTTVMTNPEESNQMNHPPTSSPTDRTSENERSLHPAGPCRGRGAAPARPADLRPHRLPGPVHAHSRTRVLSCPASTSMRRTDPPAHHDRRTAGNPGADVTNDVPPPRPVLPPGPCSGLPVPHGRAPDGSADATGCTVVTNERRFRREVPGGA